MNVLCFFSREWAAAEAREGRIVHRCPPSGQGLTPCCGKTPFEFPGWHRITVDPELVTCHGREPAS